MRTVEMWEAQGFRMGTWVLDEGWYDRTLIGDWLPDPIRFPDLRGLVDWLHGKGYAMRVWCCPCQIHPGTEIFKRAFPHACLKNKKGEPALFPGLRTFRLDPRTEIGREHVRSVIQRLLIDYDLDGFKLDFPPFNEPGDAFFHQADYDLSPEEAAVMTPDYYKLIREAIDEVKPNARVECAADIPGCEPYINDTICGDLIGNKREFEELIGVAKRLRNYAMGRDIVPWFEMIWGEGGMAPTPAVEWHAGFLEFMAISINFGLKHEHSFWPFEYPNIAQIRALSNLYGPRDQTYKVLHAGRRTMPVSKMLEWGLELDHKTRFLVAPETDTAVRLHTAPLKTNAVFWKCRNVLTGQLLDLRSRNEFWSNSLEWCMAEVDAKAGQVYELYYDGPEDDAFGAMYRDFAWTDPHVVAAEGNRRVED